MLTILRNEGVEFAGIFIDESFEQDNSPNRKPRTGLLIPYLQQNQIDLNQSYVIGDRYTDVELARNLGCKSIRFGEENDPEARSEEHTSELQSLMRISYAVFCLK